MTPLYHHPSTLTVRFDVWPFLLDMTGRYPLAQIIARMIHTAGAHADSLGFGIRDLNHLGYTWMLHRLSLDLREPITTAAPLDITTGVVDREGMVTRRIFMLHQGEKLVGTGLSHWVAISLEARRPVPVATVLTTDEYLCTQPEGIGFPTPPRKVIPPADTAALTYSYERTVRYSDLDINRHVNSSVWVAMAMDAVPLPQHEECSLHRADLHFVTEALAGDTLQVYHASRESGEQMSVRLPNGQEAFALSVMWR